MKTWSKAARGKASESSFGLWIKNVGLSFSLFIRYLSVSVYAFACSDPFRWFCCLFGWSPLVERVLFLYLWVVCLNSGSLYGAQHIVNCVYLFVSPILLHTHFLFGWLVICLIERRFYWLSACLLNADGNHRHCQHWIKHVALFIFCACISLIHLLMGLFHCQSVGRFAC